MRLRSLILQTFLAVYSFGSITFSAKLTITFKNVKSDVGNMLVLLWDDPNSYFKSTPVKQIVASLAGTKGEVEIVIDKLKKGTPYAIFAYHDENKTYALNSNIVGVPTEGYAFGNNVLPGLGLPKFKEVSVTLESDHSFLEMTLTNHKTLKDLSEEEAV